MVRLLDSSSLRVLINSEKLKINPLRNDSISAMGISLHLGGIVTAAPLAGRLSDALLADGAEISFAPGCMRSCRTIEQVTLPAGYIGRVDILPRLVQRGVVCPGGNVEPGFSGCLVLPFRNASDQPIVLKAKEYVALLSVYELRCH